MSKYLGDPQSGSRRSDTYSRNRYGQYIRNRSTPVNPNTAAQSTQRARFAAAAQAWRNLTLAQQQSWATYAAEHPDIGPLGETIILTASAMYSRIRLQAQSAGVSVSASPPADPAFVFSALSLIATVDTTGPTYSLLLTGSANQPMSYKVVVFGGPGQSPGRFYPAAPRKRLGAFNANGLIAGIELQDDWSALFGEFPAVGRRIVLQSKQYSDEGVWDGVLATTLATVVDVTP